MKRRWCPRVSVASKKGNRALPSRSAHPSSSTDVFLSLNQKATPVTDVGIGKATDEEIIKIMPREWSQITITRLTSTDSR